jgi:hypothetical protein
MRRVDVRGFSRLTEIAQDISLCPNFGVNSTSFEKIC